MIIYCFKMSEISGGSPTPLRSGAWFNDVRAGVMKFCDALGSFVLPLKDRRLIATIIVRHQAH